MTDASDTHRVAALVLMVLWWGCTQAPPEGDMPLTRDVWFVLGQSNAIGAAPASELVPPYTLPAADIPEQFALVQPAFKETTAWGPLTDSNQNGTGDTGPEATFARDLKIGGINVAILKYGVSGASLYTRWRPSANDVYPDFLAWALPRMDALPRPWRIRGVLWAGCEGDAAALVRAENIFAGLQELHDAIRADFVIEDDLRWVVIELSTAMARPFIPESNEQLVAWGDGVPTHRGFVFTNDLGLLPDQIHRTPAAQREIGHRAATVVLTREATDDEF